MLLEDSLVVGAGGAWAICVWTCCATGGLGGSARWATAGFVIRVGFEVDLLPLHT
jgi:hypothetical protein